MALTVDLRDQRAFPSFDACPDENDIDLDYYDTDDRPDRHWCLFGEITAVESFLRLRLIVRDKLGKEFVVAFYPDRGEDVGLEQYQKGHTVAILYPHQHQFLDRTTGIRQENLNTVQVRTCCFLRAKLTMFFKVIPVPLAKLLSLNDKVQAQWKSSDGQRACQVCRKQSDSILKCGRCCLGWYCSKVGCVVCGL